MAVSAPYVHTVCVCLTHSSRPLPLSINTILTIHNGKKQTPNGTFNRTVYSNRHQDTQSKHSMQTTQLVSLCNG